jgi:rRNA maturation protein Rpf1
MQRTSRAPAAARGTQGAQQVERRLTKCAATLHAHGVQLTCSGCASGVQILITTSRDPSTRLVQFAKELKLIFPNSRRMNRGGQVRMHAVLREGWPIDPCLGACHRKQKQIAGVTSSFLELLQVLPELVETCRSHGMTDIVMVHEHRGEPDGLVISHLPYGPTAYFGIFNVVGAPFCVQECAPGCCICAAFLHCCSTQSSRLLCCACDCRSRVTTLVTRAQSARCQRRTPISSSSTLARSWENGYCTIDAQPQCKIFSCQYCKYSGLQRFTVLCAALQVQNILKHLFPVPKDDSKRVMTFANMQDYISFRHHTYEQSAGIKSIALKVRVHISHAGAQHCLSSQ